MNMAQPDKILGRLLSLRDDIRSNALINTSVSGTVDKILSEVKDDNIELRVNKMWIEDKQPNSDVNLQKEVRNKGQIWSNTLRADLSLIDRKTGKEIDRQESMKLATIPKITDRNTFIVRGNEYQFTKQSRLKPGVYTKIQNNGEISSFFNVDKTVDFERGFNNNFKINFDPEKKTFIMTYGSKNIPLINALRSLGVTRKEMVEKWGEAVYSANEKAYDRRVTADQEKLYLAVFGRKPAPGANINEEIKTRLFATKLDPDVNKITLGKNYNHVSNGAILDASKKIIGIHRGDVEPDDRESLIFKSFYDVEDHMRDRLIKNSNKIIWNLKNKLKRNRSLTKSVSAQAFDPFIVGTITMSQLSTPPSQTNVLSIIGDSSKMTVMGEGGIGSSNAITNEARQISNSEAGFIDPLHTPEGGNIGITVHTAMNTVKVGNDLYSKFIDKKGNQTILRPIDVYEKYVGFPDEMGKKKKIRAIHKGELVEVNADKVNYFIPDSMDMFDTSVNQIPFLDSIQGNRGLTASKMQEQAIPLVNRDKPLFDIVDKKGRSISKGIAQRVGVPTAKKDGVVEKITPTEIVISGETYPLYNEFSLNNESFLHNEPVVKVGDTVKKGDILADNNFTRDGQTALGANLKVAYMPYKGYNYEDSAIVSESAAKKLTSTHMYDFKAKRSSKGVFSRNKFKAYYPEDLPAANADKLDADGVIKKGQRVEHGDIVIAHMERKSPTADDIAVGRLDKQLKRDMASHAQVWEKNVAGVVTDVKKHGNSVIVNIKTEEPLQVADKVSGLHGNKHIISAIVPDEEMPFNPETNERIDMTMNPIGVSNRINTSQLLENAAGKIANKTGKQFTIQNFSDADNSAMIMEELKNAGLSDKDILIDPETGKPFLNPVANGISHILKLEHVIDHKFSARYRDGYDSNEQPISGGHTGSKNLGRMEIAALMARGANENLKEMFSIKGQRNDEYWKAMETGGTLPPPKSSFAKDKMLAMMAGAGINVEQKGKTFQLRPMTDDEIIHRSRGELSNPQLTYRKKDMAPMKGGLYDPVKAGGIFGEHYTHFKLPEKMLNPATTTAAASIIGITVKGLEEVIDGKKFIDKVTGKIVDAGSENAISGGPAVETLLKKIDVDTELAAAKDSIGKTTNPTAMNKLHRKIRYLKSLKENKMKPTDYMIQNVLVTPSKYRPMFAMGTDGTVITSDINDLYQQVAVTADSMKELEQELKAIGVSNEELNLHLANARGSLYRDMKAIAGLQEPTSFLHRAKNKKGYIYQLGSQPGKQSKEGFIQDKVLERKQDLVGRSTIILNPELGGDQLGVPKEMAAKIFQPFIMKKIVSWGYSPLEASKHIDDKSSIYERALQVVSDDRLVIANRAPTIHRWNMTAMKPVLTEGKAIEVPAIGISRNWGGDFDGDSVLQSVLILANRDKFKQFCKNGGKLAFGEYGIDTDNKFEYIDNHIDNFFNQRSVVMPSVSDLPIRKGDELLHVHLEDFPRDVDSSEVKDNGNVKFKAPGDISIITVNNDTHEIETATVTEFSIHRNLENYIVKMSDRNTIMVSSDESMVAVDPDTWKIKRYSPKIISSSNLMVPKVTKVDIEPSVFFIDTIKGSERGVVKFLDCVDRIKLDREFGQYIGMMVGDGWADTQGRVNFSTTYPELLSIFSDMTKKLCGDSPFELNTYSSPHEYEGFGSYSEKHCVLNHSLALNFSEWIGKGAHKKHLPSFFINAPEEFRVGLFEGMMDTDGSSAVTEHKGRKRYQALYTTVSERLCNEFVTLARTLGILASYSYEKDRRAYQISISSTTLIGKGIKFTHKEKQKAFDYFVDNRPKELSSVESRLDLVPFSEKVYGQVKKIVHFERNKSEYNAIKDAKKKNYFYISRHAAKKIIKLDKDNSIDRRWIDIVNNSSVSWVYISNLELNQKRIDMYDITAPGPYTFMLSNGIIVQDTFQIHTPISQKAIEEAKQMMPSASMLKTGYDSVLNAPQMDMAVGAYLASKGRGGKDKGKFNSLQDAQTAFSKGDITYGDTISIGNRKSTYGLHVINAVLPDDVQKWNIELNQNNIDDWIRNVTKQHNGKIAINLADRIKEVGNNYVTTFGFTLGVSDTLVDKETRDKLIAEANKKSDKIKGFTDALPKAHSAMKKRLGDKTMLGIGMASGGSKGIANTAAISLMPGIVADANDRPIPIPITKSYSEGLDSFGYWAAAHGARAGNIKKSVSSYMPGWLTKDMINSLYETRIASEDPIDKDGIEYSVEDRKGITNRYLARDVQTKDGKILARHNDLVDSDLINKLNREKVKSVFVQSPLTDPTPGDGFSSYSYGSDYSGKRHNYGDNIGIISAHTVTEPSLNLAMKAFHTGGAVEKGKGTATVFDRLDKLLRFQKKIPNKATLSSANAKIQNIFKSPIGGYDVKLDTGETRYIDPANKPIIKKGDTVRAGDRLSTGTPSVHDILKYKGMRDAQRFLVQELDDINEGKLDKRDIETIVRGITNTTRVMHPGSSNFVAGDIAPLTTVEYFNNNNEKEQNTLDAVGDHLASDYGQYKKHMKIDKYMADDLNRRGIKRIKTFKDRVKHEPFLVPLGIGGKAGVSEDWIGRLAHNRIDKVLTEGANMGVRTEIDPKTGNPLPQYVMGEY